MIVERVLRGVVEEFKECAFGFWGIKVIEFGPVGCLRNLRAHYVETLC